jgi:hypothetical protein
MSGPAIGKLPDIARGGGNLLVNSDFRGGRLINQREKTSYTGTYTQLFDWWTTLSGGMTVELQADGVLVAPIAENGNLGQYPENPTDCYGKTYTAAIKTGGKTYLATLKVASDGAWSAAYFPGAPAGVDAVVFLADRFAFHFAGAIKVERLHIEEGEIFTGFKDESPIINLLKCRRKIIRVARYDNYRCYVNGTSAQLSVSENPMRVNPTVEGMNSEWSKISIILPNGTVIVPTAVSASVYNRKTTMTFTIPQQSPSRLPATCNIGELTSTAIILNAGP